MPQLQVGDFAPQLIWLAITFIGLYSFWRAWPCHGSKRAIERRQSHIKADLDKAERLRRETEAAIAAYDEALCRRLAPRPAAIAQKTRDELTAEVDTRTRRHRERTRRKDRRRRAADHRFQRAGSPPHQRDCSRDGLRARGAAHWREDRQGRRWPARSPKS